MLPGTYCSLGGGHRALGRLGFVPHGQTLAGVLFGRLYSTVWATETNGGAFLWKADLRTLAIGALA
jgi:hypothetical protein